MTLGLWGRIRSSTISWLVISAFFFALDVVDGFPFPVLVADPHHRVHDVATLLRGPLGRPRLLTGA